VLSKIAVSATIVVSLAFAGTAFAGKTTPSSSIAGPYLVGTSSPTGAAAVQPQFGQTITFSVSTTATSNPFVNLNCYQDGVLVMNSWSAFFRGSRHAYEHRQVEGARVDALQRERVTTGSIQSKKRERPRLSPGPLSWNVLADRAS
jgi:hypothetical protein